MTAEPEGVRTVSPLTIFEGEYERPQASVPHPSIREGREHLFRSPAHEAETAVVVKEEDLPPGEVKSTAPQVQVVSEDDDEDNIEEEEVEDGDVEDDEEDDEENDQQVDTAGS